MTNGVYDLAAEHADAAMHLWDKWIQMGFAGFALILLAIMVAAIGILARVLWALNSSVTTNTEVTRAVGQEIKSVATSVTTLTATVLQSRENRARAHA